MVLQLFFIFIFEKSSVIPKLTVTHEKNTPNYQFI